MGLLDNLLDAGGSGGLGQQAMDRLRRIDENLQIMARGERVTQNPYVAVIEGDPGGTATVDLEKVLPEQFSTGHIRNIGPEEVDVSFQSGTSNQFSAPYPLPPMDEKFDLSNYALRKIRFSFPEDNSQTGRVVVILQ